MLLLALFLNFFALVVVFLLFTQHVLGAAVGISAFVWFIFFLKKRQDKVEARFLADYHGKNILMLDKHAVLKCQESKAYSQIQGPGYLILSEDKVVFDMTLLENKIEVPLDSISLIERTKRLLGVGSVFLMLRIVFTAADGRTDSIALRVKDIDSWEKGIALAREKMSVKVSLS